MFAGKTATRSAISPPAGRNPRAAKPNPDAAEDFGPAAEGDHRRGPGNVGGHDRQAEPGVWSRDVYHHFFFFGRRQAWL